MFFAEFLYTRFASLGDSHRYLSSSITVDYHIFFSSTRMMDFLGGVIGILPSFLYHFPALLISFWGIVILYKCLVDVNTLENNNTKLLFFILMVMPSFSMWTSIHSKEAVACFFMSVLASELIYKIVLKKFQRPWLLMISFYLLLIFKPQYFVAVASAYVFILLSNNFFTTGYQKLFLLICILSVQLSLLYYFKDIIDTLSLNMYDHFNVGDAKSTRDNIYFVHEGDFFRNMVSGMFLAFWGPTLVETIHRPMWGGFFLESLLIVSILAFLLIKPYRSLFRFKINTLTISVVFLCFFWLLFVHYPFGIFNPGSAIRYRQNFYPFLVCIGLYFFAKSSTHK